MEFVLTNYCPQPGDAPNAGWEPVMSTLNSARFTHWFGPMARIDLGRNMLIAPEKALQNNSQNAIMAGYAFLNNGKRLLHQFHTMGALPVPANDLKGQNGVFALVDYCDPDAIRVWTDPSGQHLLHIYDHDGLVIVSNNLHMVRHVAEAAGRTLSRDPSGLIFSLCYGTHFGRRSGFNEVRLIEPRSGLTLGADGRLSEQEYMSQTALYYSDQTYRDEMDQAQNVLVDMSHTLLDLNQKTSVDLSGGVDSRTSLAAMLATGRQEEFGIYNLSRRPNPDRLVPEQIVERFGLSVTDAVNGNLDHAIAIEERCRRGIYRFCGMRLIDQPDVGDQVLPNLTWVSGGYGELGSGPAPSGSVWALKKDGPSAFTDAWVRRQPPPNLFLTAQGVDRAAGRITQTVAESLAGGIPVHMIDTVVYAENKALHHFGTSHRHFNDIRVHIPLLNLIELVRCGSRLNIAKVKNRKVHFDLIMRLQGKELALMPLAGSRWGKAAIPERLLSEWETVPRVTVDTPPLAPAFTNITRRPVPQVSPSPEDAAFRQRMLRKGLNTRFQNAPAYLRLLEQAFETISAQDDIWTWLDRNELEREILQSEDEMLETALATPPRVGRYAMLTQGLLWYAGQEQPYAVHVDGSHLNAV